MNMDDKILFSQINHLPKDMAAFTPEDIEAAQARFSQADWQELMSRDESEQTWHIGRALYLHKCQEEARRLGLPLHPTLFNHNPIALVDFAKGVDAGRELMVKYKFTDVAAQSGYGYMRDGKYFPVPETMWHVLATRRDGDAVIAFIGDDRGWENNWEYFVAVAWAPREMAEESGYVPALL
jgi:hypothetical protein